MIAAPGSPRLLDGVAGTTGAESLDVHRRRHGPRPRLRRGDLVDELERAGLRGRGGAAYPTHRKWRAVLEQESGQTVVVANGAETEPLSAKDCLLLSRRPHLVLDGVALAAEAVGARRAMIYISREAAESDAALRAALAERRAAREPDPALALVRGPHRYVAGEETAVVAVLNGGRPRPTLTPPRPFARGVDGQPTLVQNVETLAHAALISRHGSDWFRGLGTADAPGSVLVTVAGSVLTPAVCEVPAGATVATVVGRAGGAVGATAAFLVGGYFGRWTAAADAWDLRLGVDLPLGSGVLAVFPQGRCGVSQAAAITAFLARESARQCGPCEHGLSSLADTMADLASAAARPADVDRLQRWIGQIAGRGACHHPDGALVMLESALRTFAGDVSTHARRRRCDRDPQPLLPTPDWGRRG